MHNNCYCQKKFPYGGVYFYSKIDRYVYNDSSHSYSFIDSVLTSKAISIDPIKIFIESFDHNQDLSLKIIDYVFVDSLKKDLYICEYNSCVYYFQVTQDKSESILLFNNKKIVFHSSQDKQKGKTPQSSFILVNNEVVNDGIVYIDLSLDIKPIYKNCSDYDMSLTHFKHDLENSIIQTCDTLGLSEITISFIINKDGVIVKPSILRKSSVKQEDCVLSVIMSMSGWIPGIINDIQVTTLSIITINLDRN